jgi:membrane protein implicated in regulation of membrane protease activity
MKKKFVIGMVFLLCFLSHPLSTYGKELEIHMDRGLYPTIHGYYYAPSMESNTVQVANSSIQTKERIIRFPFNSQPKIYLLIQNSPSYTNIRERAHREVLLMEIEKERKKQSFFNNIVIFTFGSAIQEIPFPTDKLSTYPVDPTSEKGQLESLLEVLRSKEMNTSQDVVIIIIGDGTELPSFKTAFAPIFYFQTNDLEHNTSQEFIIESTGGMYANSSSTYQVSQIETTIRSRKQPLHSFVITIPLPKMLFPTQITINYPSNPFSVEVQPVVSLHNLIDWALLFIAFLIILLFVWFVLRCIQSIVHRRKTKRNKREREAEQKYLRRSLQFLVQEPGKKPRYVSVNTSSWIGSSKDCQVSLQDISVSLEHCYVQKTTNGFFVVDLQSCNGTSVNGKSIQRKKLYNNDVLQVGETTLTVKEEL